MTLVALEPWADKRGVAEVFAVSVRTIEYWTKEGMPSAIIAGRRKYRPSECEAWLERAGHLRRSA